MTNTITKITYDGNDYEVGTGDVVGPASSTDGHLALFDGATGKLIKDGGVVPTGVPAVGTNGQVLTVVSGAAAWANVPSAPVSSVNSQTGTVVLDADDISDSTTTNKFVTATDKSTWSGKQDALTLPSTPTSGHLVTWGADNKTLADGGTVPIGVPAVGTNGQVLTVVSGAVAWANASGGDVQVSTQANNILTSGMKIWAGLETDYQNLGSYDQNTLYLTI